MSDEEKIVTNNVSEEIEELIEKCIKCGMCKSICPVYHEIFEETISPRGKVLLLKNKVYDSLFYNCALCKACEQKCPAKIKLCEAFKKARQVLIDNKKETEVNKKMIKNIREVGNPLGKEPEKAKDLFCC
ncbi:hypothetical protein COV15_02230 [Candidatus Woesearchaeota archaeon CG10_big_fil_rev_8_21_14_0_10_34_12]|nr:MAG: hypothetical protein COV15_02230 [Candidatus Woesearchaeota archaeon CG10_big_fil_rev_8_21_14_0_10_34_12]